MNTLFRALLQRPAPKGDHLAVLDGVRGIAVLLVIASHSSLIGIHMVPGVDMSGTGKVGVYLFFVLSAFLLVAQATRQDARGALGPVFWWHYTVRRILRIYPLYVVFLLFCLWVPVKTQFGVWTLTDVANHLLVREGRWHTWSIAVELRWYAVLPLLVLLWVHIARRSLMVATLLLATAIAVRDWINPPFDVDALHTYIGVFCLGTWVALAHRSISLSPLSGESWLPRTAALISLICLLVVMVLTPSVLSAVSGHTVPMNHWHRSHTLFALLWSAFLLGMLWSPRWLRAAASVAPLRLLGTISFSAYLWHGVLLDNLGWLPNSASNTTRAALLMSAIVVVATVSYVVIERPFMMLSARLTRSRHA